MATDCQREMCRRDEAERIVGTLLGLDDMAAQREASCLVAVRTGRVSLCWLEYERKHVNPGDAGTAKRGDSHRGQIDMKTSGCKA
jgi:hypothetical protein